MPFIVPGQGFRKHAIYKKSTCISDAGSVGRSTSFTLVGTLTGITTSMSPRERDSYKQDGYEVSDKVVQHGSVKAEKGQYLVYDDHGKYRFYEIQAVRNPAHLDHFSVYIVNERSDLQYVNTVSTTDFSYYGGDTQYIEKIVIGA